MMKEKYILYAALIATMFTACGNKEKKSYDTIGKSGLTTRTELLRQNLRSMKDRGVLFGQQYGMFEGIGWENDSNRSDFMSICKDNPACVGYEISGIERGQKMNSDSLSFDAIRKNTIDYFHRGGLVTISWTAHSVFGDSYGGHIKTDSNGTKYLFDEEMMSEMKAWTKKVAVFINSLQDGYGIKVPVVLSLYPLDGSSWYCDLSTGDYIKLYQQTIKWLREDSVNNVIFAYSQSMTIPDEARFFACYPGEGVDVVNFNYIQNGGSSDTFKGVMDKMLSMLTAFGDSHQKIIGVTAGIEGIPDKTFWSGTLLPLLQKYQISYFMLGKNCGDANEGHFCAPYPGEKSVPDFVKLYNDASTMFLSEVNGLYLDHPKQSR